MKTWIPLMLSAALLCSACSSENEDNGKTIQLAEGTSPTLVLDSKTSTDTQEQIKFTATSAWTAWIKAATDQRSGGSEVDWLTLSAYSGPAGEQSLTLTISPNTGTTSRKAVITIECGGQSLTITVEQAGSDSSEEVTTTKLVKEIRYTADWQRNTLLGISTTPEVTTWQFSYDDQNRMTGTSIQKEGQQVNRTFTYTSENEITLDEKETYNSYSYETRYLIQLNEAGNATSVLHDDKETGNYTPYINFTYTDDGRLAQMKDADAGEEGSEYTFTYADGKLASFEYYNGKYTGDNYSYTFDATTDFTHQYPNQGPIDIMGYLLTDDDFDFLFHLGRMGKTGDYLPEHFSGQAMNQAISPQKAYLTPGVTEHESSKYIKEIQKPYDLNYTFDNEQNLQSIIIKQYFEVVTREYDVVVGTELIDPRDPNRGYEYEIKNVKETTQEGYDTLTFEITYN